MTHAFGAAKIQVKSELVGMARGDEGDEEKWARVYEEAQTGKFVRTRGSRAQQVETELRGDEKLPNW